MSRRKKCLARLIVVIFGCSLVFLHGLPDGGTVHAALIMGADSQPRDRRVWLDEEELRELEELLGEALELAAEEEDVREPEKEIGGGGHLGPGALYTDIPQGSSSGPKAGGAHMQNTRLSDVLRNRGFSDIVNGWANLAGLDMSSPSYSDFAGALADFYKKCEDGALTMADVVKAYDNLEGDEWSSLASKFLELLEKMMKTPDNVNCYKPNIYIYTDRETRLEVLFEEPELLTASIPEYGAGWTVTAEPDQKGTCTLKDPSGGTYRYLFYESVSSLSLFQTEAGYRIDSAAREGQFREILAGMGFNGQETEDFVEYWSERLEPDTNYIMYPQDTARVDLAMPVTVTPQPDRMERIWFLFLEDEGQPVEEPEPLLLDREGGCVMIEWGGMLRDGTGIEARSGGA